MFSKSFRMLNILASQISFSWWSGKMEEEKEIMKKKQNKCQKEI